MHPLFLEHFGDTCLVVEDQGKLVAFLVGMFSQRYADTAYVHFLGVHPDYRRLGLGRELYERFFALAVQRGRTVISAETGAFNTQSIAFHRRLAFAFEGGDELVATSTAPAKTLCSSRCDSTRRHPPGDDASVVSGGRLT